MKGSWLRLFFLVCAGVLFVTSLSFAAGTIKVGIVDTYSGPAGVFGMDMLDGFKMAANEINAKGGVLGRKIEWDYANLRATNAPEAAPFIKRPVYRKGWDDILKA